MIKKPDNVAFSNFAFCNMASNKSTNWCMPQDEKKQLESFLIYENLYKRLAAAFYSLNPTKKLG